MKTVILTAAVLLVAARLHAGDVAIIVNAAGPLQGISRADVREIYLGNMRFIKGEAVVPIHYREGPVKEAFLSSIVEMSSKEYRRYWIRKVFQEGIQIPVSEENPYRLLSVVQRTARAVGYVPVSDLDQTQLLGVKIIATVPP